MLISRMDTDTANPGATPLPRLSGGAFARSGPLHQAHHVEEARRLLDIATGFRRDGWPDKAKRFARRALSIFERESRTDHPDCIRALLCLAGAREDLADHTLARADYRRASDLLDRLPTSPTDTLEAHALRVQAIRGLAAVILALGEDRQAEAMLKHALAVAHHAFGSEHPEVAAVLNDLGSLYGHSGLHEEAARLHHLALTITEKALGPEDLQGAAILYRLSLLEHARGRFTVGEPLARRSAAIRQTTLGIDHPLVAAALSSVAALLNAQQKHFEAALVQKRARTTLDRWFGDSYQAVPGTDGQLARTARPAPEQPRPDAPADTRCA